MLPYMVQCLFREGKTIRSHAQILFGRYTVFRQNGVPSVFVAVLTAACRDSFHFPPEPSFPHRILLTVLRRSHGFPQFPQSFPQVSHRMWKKHIFRHPQFFSRHFLNAEKAKKFIFCNKIEKKKVFLYFFEKVLDRNLQNEYNSGNLLL